VIAEVMLLIGSVNKRFNAYYCLINLMPVAVSILIIERFLYE